MSDLGEYRDRKGAALRGAAFFIDLIFLGAIESLLVGVAIQSGYPLDQLRGLNLAQINHFLVRDFKELVAGFALIMLAYYSGEVLAATSPGKILMRQVIRHKSGKPCAAWRLLVRYLLKNAAAVTVIYCVIMNDPRIATFTAYALYGVLGGLLFVIFPTRQTLYDYIAGTAVFSTNFDPNPPDERPGTGPTARPGSPDPESLFNKRW